MASDTTGKPASGLSLLESAAAAGAQHLTFGEDKAQAVHQIATDFLRAHQQEFFRGTADERLVTSTTGQGLYLVSRKNEVRPLPAEMLALMLRKQGIVLLSRHLREVERQMRVELAGTAINLDTVLPITTQEDSRLAWTKFKLSMKEIQRIELTDLPEFGDFLRRAGSGAESLVLWLGSILDPESGRAQYLHVQGPGGDGKSTLLESIRRAIGTNKVVTTSARLFNSQYFGAQLEGARILAFSDENNPSFFSSGKFKQFLGDHVAEVNVKNQPMKNINLTHKTIVFSNNDVQITNTIADMRRLISIKMEPDTSNAEDGRDYKWWHDGLLASGAQILGYCYKEYLKASSVDRSVRAYIPANLELVKEAVERKYEEVLGAIQQYFEITKNPEDRLKVTDVSSALCDLFKERRSNSVFTSHIREALEFSGVKRVKNSVYYYVGIKRQVSEIVGRIKVAQQR